MSRLQQVGRDPERHKVRHHQRAVQDGRGQGQLLGDQEQVLGTQIQAAGAGSCYRGATA